MTSFAKLQSDEGREALLRALEVPSVQRVATGKLVIDDILGMKEIETEASFRLIRWPDSNGTPTCPKCSSTVFYPHGTKVAWRCKHCASDFTTTSGTILSSRKAPVRNYLFALSLILERSQFRSILQFTKELNLNYKSAYVLLRKLQACITDANGCTVPFSLLSRAAWLLHRSSVRSNVGGLSVSASESSYPYLSETNKERDGAELLSFVNKLVPRGLPDYVRADICQDMIVAILSGDATRASVTKDTRTFIATVFQQSPWKYKWLSMDQPVGDDKSFRHEMMADPASLSESDLNAFHYRQHPDWLDGEAA